MDTWKKIIIVLAVIFCCAYWVLAEIVRFGPDSGAIATTLDGSISLSSQTVGILGGERLGGGSTSYIQNTNSLQAGSTFYVASGTVSTLYVQYDVTASSGIFDGVRSTGSAFLATTGGSIGIGISTPIVKLDITQSGAQTVRMRSDTSNSDLRLDSPSASRASLQFYRGGSLQWIFGLEGSDDLTLNGLITNNINIDRDTGNIGINGVPTTGRKFTVSGGSVAIQGGGGSVGALQVESHIDASSGTFTREGSEGLRVASSAYVAVLGGSVGVGTVSPSSKLDIEAGSVTIKGAGAGLTVSNGSMTFTANNSRVIYNETNACGRFVFDAGHNFDLSIDSSPTEAVGYVTFNARILTSSNARMALLYTQCIIVGDGVADDVTTTLFLRKTGSADTLSEANKSCVANSNNANDDSNDTNYDWVPLDSSQQFDYACSPGGAGGIEGNECLIKIAGYCE